MSALATRQFGLVARRQLTSVGVSSATVAAWQRAAYLYRRLPGVFAVGHCAPSIEAELAASLLWAGPGAMLSHATAVWWLGLTGRRPAQIHVSTPRSCGSLPGIRVYGRRHHERAWHRELPIAPLAQVLLDYAATSPSDDVRFALARGEYNGWLDVEALYASLSRGKPGSARLREALAGHRPQLAFTRSECERCLLSLCERHAIPLPEFNVYVEGKLVDAFWRRHKVIVETDGRDAHSRWGQIQSDHERDLVLRAAGYIVLRYTWRQLSRQPAAVARDIRAALSPTGRSDARGSR